MEDTSKDEKSIESCSQRIESEEKLISEDFTASKVPKSVTERKKQQVPEEVKFEESTSKEDSGDDDRSSRTFNLSQYIQPAEKGLLEDATFPSESEDNDKVDEGLTSKLSQLVIGSKHAEYSDSSSSSHKIADQKLVIEKGEIEENSSEGDSGDEDLILQNFICSQYIKFEERTQSECSTASLNSEDDECLAEQLEIEDEDPTSTFRVKGKKLKLMSEELKTEESSTEEDSSDEEELAEIESFQSAGLQQAMRSDSFTESFGESFDHNNALLLHKSSHDAEKNAICRKCNKLFAKERHLQQYVKSNPFCFRRRNCSVWRRLFRKLQRRNTQELKHSIVTQYECYICRAPFRTSEELQKHLHIHRKSVRCKYCYEIFENITLLTEHIKNQHKHQCNKFEERTQSESSTASLKSEDDEFWAPKISQSVSEKTAESEDSAEFECFQSAIVQPPITSESVRELPEIDIEFSTPSTSDFIRQASGLQQDNETAIDMEDSTSSYQEQAVQHEEFAKEETRFTETARYTELKENLKETSTPELSHSGATKQQCELKEENSRDNSKSLQSTTLSSQRSEILPQTNMRCEAPAVAGTSSDQQIGDGLQLTCIICHQRFKNAQTFLLHLLHYQKSYTCDNCGKLFHTVERLEKHCCENRLRSFTCYNCGASFDHMDALLLHRSTTHNIIRNVKCHKCNKLFAEKRYLQYHVKSNPFCFRGYRCSICRQCFKKARNRTVHEREHGVVKEYQCHVCAVSFQTNEELKKHLHIHKKLVRCKYCDEIFGSMSLLWNHLKNTHHQK